jgi:hypothetical protein
MSTCPGRFIYAGDIQGKTRKKNQRGFGKLTLFKIDPNRTGCFGFLEHFA